MSTLGQAGLDYYGIYAEKLEETRVAVVDEITAMLDGISSDPEQAPAEHVKSRIKSPDSIKAKLRKSGFPEDPGSGILNLSDVIGIRVVTHFIGDIYSVLDMVGENSEWDVVEVKDYIAAPKPNGYRSLHVIVAVPFSAGDFSSIRVEIQLRTIAMDCWASLEHQLQYKKDVCSQLLIDELKRCADEMASTDLSMQTIRDVISRKGDR